VFGIVAGLLSVRSRGSVHPRSADPADPPRIDIAHLRHPEDVTRMIEATRHARLLSRTPPLAGFITGAELTPGLAISDDDIASAASFPDPGARSRVPATQEISGAADHEVSIGKASVRREGDTAQNGRKEGPSK
jgi:choline dehydrogenase-like flavoprotein